MEDAKKNLYIRVNDRDNVAIIVNEGGVKAGGAFKDGLVSLEEIPQAHKIALADILSGGEVIRYGEVIGHAAVEIRKGQWVNEHNVRIRRAVDVSSIQGAAEGQEIEWKRNDEEEKTSTFMGYRNDDGSFGTRNILGITTTVQCVEGVVNACVKKIREEILPKFENVDDVVALNHAYGCGVAINGKNAEIPIRTILNMSKNANFGNQMLTVSLGCEKLTPERLFTDIEDEDLVILQECHGFQEMVDEIVKKASKKLEILNRRQRTECPASGLVVGLQCGGSDAFSGVTSNPVLGHAADLLVQAGAKVMFSEVSEVRDAVHLLGPRTASADVLEKLKKEMSWYDDYLEKGGVDRDANPTPGNKQGGLANIIEKSLGSVAKSGSSRIVDVLSPGERVRKSGLTFAATPASDFVCGTLQFASGMTLQVFSTGRGTTYNLNVAPVIKVSSNSALKAKWSDLIDLDAGKVATGEKTIEEMGMELFQLILDVASGRTETYGDKYGLYNALVVFNPAPVT